MTTRAVIFDLFGTLVDEIDRSADPFFHRLAEIMHVDLGVMLQRWDLPAHVELRNTGLLRDYFTYATRDFGGDRSSDTVLAAVRCFSELIRRLLAPRPDAVSTLQEIKRRGLSTALLTNCNSEVPRLWPETPFVGLVDLPIFSASVGLKKPDPRIFQLALDGLHVAPSDCLYVGDGGANELHAATHLGMRAVMVRTNYHGGPDAYYLPASAWAGPRVPFLADTLRFLDPPIR